MKNIAIIPNLSKDGAAQATDKVLKFLNENGVAVFSDESYSNVLKNKNIKFLKKAELFSSCDCAIVLGGDGTILASAYAAAVSKCPLLCINFGRIGYMTELEADEISDYLKRVIDDDYGIEERMMLDVSIMRNNREVIKYAALNEAVVARGSMSRMLSFDLKCDGTRVNSYHADAIIISTPTGSTAYLMSAGGPVIDSKLSVICVCPVCSHSLAGARPLVFSPESVISVVAQGGKDVEMFLTVDGRHNFKLNMGDIINVKRSSLVTRLIKLKSHGFYDILYKKFNDISGV